MAELRNVHADYHGLVVRDALASVFASAVEGMFTITGYSELKKLRGRYVTLFCKPTKAISDSLLLNREVLAVLTTYAEIDPRTIKIAKDLITSRSPQLATEIVIVLHSDPQGDAKLRQWGKEQSLRVVPLYRAGGTAKSPPETLRQLLSSSLLSADPFQVTGPVADDADFFGRKEDALDVLRQLRSGRIRAAFGMRKTGKTSFINRIVSQARALGSPRVVMIDCSVKDFNRLDAQGALRAVAKASKVASNSGYAHITEALTRHRDELLPAFSDLWLKERTEPLAIVFDEVDYITPGSQQSPHWQTEFVPFWGELRVLVQEAQRNGVSIAVMVSGVSSKYFREGFVGGVENQALHFIPNEYLRPFARNASVAMLAELSKRCGLRFESGGLNAIAEVCGDMPFWMRMAGSYIHRAIDLDARPYRVSDIQTQEWLAQFVAGDGAEVAGVALQHLDFVYPEAIDALRQILGETTLGAPAKQLLQRYGLLGGSPSNPTVCELVKAGIVQLDSTDRHQPDRTEGPRHSILTNIEWAEELALIGRRRNLLERGLREQVRSVLRLAAGSKEKWIDRVLQAVPEERRKQLVGLAGGTLLERLYWLELKSIIIKNWTSFERIFGSDQTRFETAMSVCNERPDAHAKTVDAADLALHRRELDWLESKLE